MALRGVQTKTHKYSFFPRQTRIEDARAAVQAAVPPYIRAYSLHVHFHISRGISYESPETVENGSVIASRRNSRFMPRDADENATRRLTVVNRRDAREQRSGAQTRRCAFLCVTHIFIRLSVADKLWDVLNRWHVLIDLAAALTEGRFSLGRKKKATISSCENLAL